TSAPARGRATAARQMPESDRRFLSCRRPAPETAREQGFGPTDEEPPGRRVWQHDDPVGREMKLGGVIPCPVGREGQGLVGAVKAPEKNPRQPSGDGSQ